ncbi:ABC transporter ATP-binding protein/permease [Chloroflexi bacterium TSY]|nr:ABC transporter ATP-binding protein/permease [Chloroflexi bacterium TSY]
MKPFWYIWQLARFRFGLYLVNGLLTSILFYLFPLVPGLIVREILDSLSEHAQLSISIWGLCALFIGTALAQYSLTLGSIAADLTQFFAVGALVRKNLLAQILQQSGDRPLPASSGEAIGRFRDDVDGILDFLGWTFDPLGQAIMLIVALGVLVSINPLITLTVVVPLLVALVIIHRATKRIQSYRRRNQEAIAAVTGFLGEIFSAIQTIQIASAELRTVSHLKFLNKERHKAVLKDLLFTQMLDSVSITTAYLGTGTLLFVVSNGMRGGSFTIGDFALFISYLGWLTQATSFFGNYLTLYRQMGVSLERLFTLLQEAPHETLVEHDPSYRSGRPSRSKFGVFDYFQSGEKGFWGHFFRSQLPKTANFISRNRLNFT